MCCAHASSFAMVRPGAGGVVLGGVQKGCRTPYGTPPLAKVCITHFTEEYIKEKKK